MVVTVARYLSMALSTACILRSSRSAGLGLFVALVRQGADDVVELADLRREAGIGLQQGRVELVAAEQAVEHLRPRIEALEALLQLPQGDRAV